MEDYHNIFLEQIRNYGSLIEAAKKDLLSRVSRAHRMKGLWIIREGQVATSLFIVEKGMVRSFYQREKTGITGHYEKKHCLTLRSRKPLRTDLSCFTNA